jgi:hypothetical protein
MTKLVRLEIMDDKEGVYIAIIPDGIVHRSKEIDEKITADYDKQNRLIGLEIAFS